MAARQIQPGTLLDAADRFLTAAPGGPDAASDRRAVSTAYYALFHAITGRVASAIIPTADEVVRGRVRRWIGHGSIRAVAVWVAQLHGGRTGSPPPHIVALRRSGAPSPLVGPDTVEIAEGFIEMNEARHLADYDHEAVISREDARGHLDLARSVVALVERASSPEAACFFGLIALQARIQGR